MHHHQWTEGGHAVSTCLYLWVYPISTHVHWRAICQCPPVVWALPCMIQIALRTKELLQPFAAHILIEFTLYYTGFTLKGFTFLKCPSLCVCVYEVGGICWDIREDSSLVSQSKLTGTLRGLYQTGHLFWFLSFYSCFLSLSVSPDISIDVMCEFLSLHD